MGDVIRFPRPRPEIEELRAFGSVGGLTVSIVREEGDDTSPITIVLASDNPRGKLQGVMAFKPEGREVAEIVDNAVMRTLLAANRLA